jgi:glycosyltransferase involved in cell wall biosynthesis
VGDDRRLGTLARRGGRELKNVDVGIPTRPATQYLQSAVESVVAQTHRDWQVHVSINGTDGGEAATQLERVADPRVSWSVAGAELSASQNSNRALQAGDAPYVATLHDDDRWRPEFLESHVEFLEQNPQCGFVFSGVMLLDGRGKVLGPKLPPIEEGVHPSERISERLFRGNLVNVAAVVVRRSALDAVGGAFREDIVFFDHELWIRLASRFDVGVLHRCDGEYRLHSRAASWEKRLELGQCRLEVLAATEEYARVDTRTRERAYGSAYAMAALDAVERGNRGEAVALLRRVVRTFPGSVPAPGTLMRSVGAAVALACGGVGRRLLTGYRVRGATGGRPGRLLRLRLAARLRQ